MRSVTVPLTTGCAVLAALACYRARVLAAR